MHMAVYGNCYMRFLILACGKQVGEQESIIYNRGKVKLSCKGINSYIDTYIHAISKLLLFSHATLSLSIAPQAACKE